MNFYNKKKYKTVAKIKNINNLDMYSLFKLENNILKQLQKNNSTKDIINYKNYLIEINNIKDNYNKSILENKLIYLKQEYKFLKKQININIFFKRNEQLNNKIKNQIKDCKNNYLLSKYKKIQKKHIYIFKELSNINCFSSNNKKISISEKIQWYEYQIEKIIKKKLMLENHIFCLKNLYDDIKEEKMLEFTIK